MKLIFQIPCLQLLLASCGSVNFMNSSNPRKQSFKYYDQRFTFNKAARLQLNRKYVLYKKYSVDVLVFFDDGFLNNHSTPDGSGVGTKRVTSSVIMGYYKLQQDSIFFTTKSYYQHRPTYYRGLIKNDTIDLRVKYPKKKTEIRETYVLSN